jgi:hypothetical protein
VAGKRVACFTTSENDGADATGHGFLV